VVALSCAQGLTVRGPSWGRGFLAAGMLTAAILALPFVSVAGFGHIVLACLAAGIVVTAYLIQRTSILIGE